MSTYKAGFKITLFVEVDGIPADDLLEAAKRANEITQSEICDMVQNGKASILDSKDMTLDTMFDMTDVTDP